MASPLLSPTRSYMDGRNRMVREHAGGRTVIELDNEMVRWATTPRVTQEFLDRLAGSRSNAPTRAPLGESGGAWEKICEIPVSYLMGKLPPEAWEDRKALARIINDRDLRKLRCDAEGRTY